MERLIILRIKEEEEVQQNKKNNLSHNPQSN